MVSHINSKLDTVKPLCSKLYLKRILNAVQVIPNEKVKHVRKTMMAVLIIIIIITDARV